ncbi:MAG: hypothetical protein V5A28_01165 [Haloarculaceae archaeon]
MTDITIVVVFAKALVLPLGVGISYFAYRAYRRTGAAAMRSFAAGFAVVTAGSVLGGGLEQLVGVGLEAGLLVDSVLTAVGFVILARSLYVTDSRLGADDSAASSSSER